MKALKMKDLNMYSSYNLYLAPNNSVTFTEDGAPIKFDGNVEIVLKTDLAKSCIVLHADEMTIEMVKVKQLGAGS